VSDVSPVQFLKFFSQLIDFQDFFLSVVGIGDINHSEEDQEIDVEKISGRPTRDSRMGWFFSFVDLQIILHIQSF